MSTTFTATHTTLRGLGLSFGAITIQSSLSSSQESFDSLFSETVHSSSASQTDPELSTTLNSSDEDDATLYSDEDPDINYFDPYPGGDVEVSNFLPWPSPESAESSCFRNDLQDSYSSSIEHETVDHGYESDTEDHYDITTITPPLCHARGRYCYSLKHTEPFLQTTDIHHIAPVNFVPSDVACNDDYTSGYESDFANSPPGVEALVENSPALTPAHLVGLGLGFPRYDEPNRTTRFVSNHPGEELPNTTSTLAGLGLGLPGYDESTHLTRLIGFAVSSIEDSPQLPNTMIALAGLGLGLPNFDEPTRLLTHPTLTRALPTISPAQTSTAQTRRSRFGRSPSFVSVDLNNTITVTNINAIADVENNSSSLRDVPTTPPTPDLRPSVWVTGGSTESPSPILLSSPLVISTFFRLVDAPELAQATGPSAATAAPLHIAAREPLDTESLGTL